MNALVTGASSGIGLQYSRELASRGYDVVMVSNQEVEIKQCAEDIAKEFSVKTYPIFKGTLRPTKDLNNIGNYGTFILNRLNNAINSLSDNDLCRIIFESLSDPNYTFDNENIVQSTFGNKDYLFPNALGVRLAL